MFGQYAPFIIPAYLISAVTLSMAAVWIIVVYRARQRELRELRELESAGVKRRSQGPDNA